MKWRSYPEYKDSGVEWPRKVPEHWKMQSIRNIIDMSVSNVDKHTKEDELSVRLCNYIDVYKNDQITEHISFMRATATTEEIERFRLEPDDVLITKDSETWNDIGIPALVKYTADDLVCGYHLALLRPRKTLIRGPFLLRALQCPEVAFQFHVAANGVTRYGLSHGSIKSVLLPISPITEQVAIAAFLDRKTEMIDSLIAKKVRLIELLQEKRAALINHAVTKGLDPSVPMKDSGLEWIGEIPAHWDVLPFKYVTNRVDVGIAEATAHAYADEGVPIIRSTNVKPNNLDLNDIFYIEKWFAEKNRSKYLNKGDIVTVRTGNAGISAVVPPSLHKSQCFTMLISTLCKHQLAEFYCFYFNAIPGQTVFKLEGWGTAQINISVPILKNLTVVSPQYEEQQKIVSYLENQTARIDSILSKIYEAIKKLKEYRTALISSAVTGKIDVRQEVA